MKHFLYILLTLLLSNNAIGQESVIQKKDSSSSSRLKGFKIGIEYGRSPRVVSGYTYSGTYSRPYPYYKIYFGYNAKVRQDKYLVCSFGVAGEESYYSYTNNTTTEFVYVDTVNSNVVFLNGTKQGVDASYFKTKTNFCTFDIGFQQIFSPFKDERLKVTYLIGLTTKPTVYKETRTTFTHYKDSTTHIGKYELLKTREEYSTKSKVKVDGPVDWMLNLNLGFVYYQQYIQHQIGLNFIAQYTSPSTTYLYYSGRFIRLYYSINF